MAAEADIDGEGEAPAKKGKGRLIIIIAGAVAVLLIGAGLFLFLTMGKAPPADAAHGGDAAHGDAASAASSFIFNLQPMTVNLNSDDGTEAFMKLTIALEVANQEVMTQIQPRMAKVIDAFQVYLRELRKSDLQGSAGIYRLKEELLRRINVAIYPTQVDSILFKEILVQ